MKFRVEREVLAEAVAWTARSLPSRPPVPVLAGILLEVAGESLTLSAFDYEVSTKATIDVHAQSAGRALVSGRLLADIAKALPPHPVEVAVDGPRLTISCGSARFTLPTMPVEDYPSLPKMPTATGVVASADFDIAVSQVAVAAGRDDTLPMLTGVRLEIDGDRLTLAATDRYRLAVREFPWSPETDGQTAAVLVPARSLADAAKTLTGGAEVTLALSSGGSGEGIMGFASSAGGGGAGGGSARHATTRLLDAEFPPYRKLLPAESAATAEVRVAGFVEAVKRVALVAERGTPVRLTFGPDGLRLLAGGEDEGRAEEQMDADYAGDPMTIGFNPTFLLDGLSAVHTETVRMAFTTPNKPAVLTGVPAEGPGNEDYRYLIMPVRLPS